MNIEFIKGHLSHMWYGLKIIVPTSAAMILFCMSLVWLVKAVGPLAITIVLITMFALFTSWVLGMIYHSSGNE